MYMPLTFIVFLSIVKDGYEDYQRYKADQTENRKPAFKLDQNGQVISVEQSTLRVGDIIRLKENEFAPADILILATDDPKGIYFP